MMHDFEKRTHPLADKHIIVAGAGIAGLAFVQGLSRYWPLELPRPRVSVYERDPRVIPPERGSYSLGLRSDGTSGGLQALKKLGLLDDILKARTPGSTAGAIIRDANWDAITKIKRSSAPPDGLPVSNMRITRNDLRECLINGVDHAEMHWELACISASPAKHGKMEISLSDGSTDECDLLIVADGASSKLRGCLRPQDGLNYAGAVVIGGNATFPDGTVPAKIKEGFGPLLGGDGHGLVVFPTDEHSVVWFVTRRSPSSRTPVKGPQAIKMKDEITKEALSEGRVFAEPFPTLVAATDPSTLKIFNAMDKKPILHSQISELPCIFIGDSNHAVSPFAGNGANMALMDGVSLAESLCSTSSITSAVDAFDKESIPRCNKSIKRSHIVIWLSHSTGWTLWLAILVLRIVSFFIK